MYQRYSSGRGCIWRRPLVAVVGVLPSLQVAVSGRSVLLPRDLAAIRMCARASNGLYSPGPLQVNGFLFVALGHEVVFFGLNRGHGLGLGPGKS